MSPSPWALPGKTQGRGSAAAGRALEGKSTQGKLSTGALPRPGSVPVCPASHKPTLTEDAEFMEVDLHLFHVR